MSITWLGKVFCFLFFAFPAHPFELDFRLAVLGGGTYQDYLKNSVYNPGNQIFEFTNGYGFGEIRPDADLRAFDVLRFVVRPRFRGTIRQKPDIPGFESRADLFDSYINEAFIETSIADFLQISAGRQNYQWGPAESLNPTSFFFPDLTFRVEPFYEVRGRTMARANFSFGGQWSWIMMAELESMKDQSFETPAMIADYNDERVAGKLEYTWDSGAKNIGLVAGKREDQGVGGAYLMWTANEDWQFYGDVLMSQGTKTFYATVNPLEPLKASPDKTLYAQGILGLRYTFTSGTEWRWEWLFNQSGYTLKEQRELRSLFAVNPLLVPAWTAHQSFPLLGQNYIYSSLRHNWNSTWLGVFRQPVLAVRWIHSMADSSVFLSGSLESGLLDSGTVYFYGGAALGEPDNELRRGLDKVVGIAYRHSFL